MVKALFLFVLSCLVSLSLIPQIMQFSLRLKLFDDQDLYRKDHKYAVSRMGGVAIFIGYFLVVNAYLDLSNISSYALLGSTSIIFFLGLKDDLLGGAIPLEKFFIQLFAVILLLIFNEPTIEITFSSTYLSMLSNFLELLMPICLLLFIINAFNFIDGINGLAGVLGVLINVFIGSVLILWGDREFGFSAFILAGSTVGFLRYNFIPGKVFMGDSGAMLIGLSTGFICLRFISLDSISQEIQFSSPGLVVLALLIVPTFDVIRIFIIRIFHRKSLLVGDRNHLHHRIKDLGMRDFQIVIILLLFTSICLVIVILDLIANVFMTIGLLIFLCVLCNSMLSYIRGRHFSRDYTFSDVIFIDTLNRR